MRSSSAASVELPRPVATGRHAHAVKRRTSTSFLLPLFVISMALPIMFYVGPLRLAPYRVMLVVLFVPCVIAWLSGATGKIRLPDILILCSALWGALALTVHDGIAETWEPSGILIIETFGAYLLARLLIRTKDNFLAMVRTLFWVIAFLLPFAALEALTNQHPLLAAFSLLGETVSTASIGQRLGLHRANVVFEHPILYGVFCASGLGLVFYVRNSGRLQFGTLFRSGIVTLAAVLSVSTGALAALVMQFLLVAWDYGAQFMKRRWRVLGLLSLAAYITVDLISNRSPFHVFVTYLTLNVGSAYHRILIWQFGTENVMQNPWFGTGLTEWDRPSWMGDSIDNFWLVVAVRYGLPAFVLLAGAVLLVLRGLGRANLDSEQLRGCRAGLLVSLGGLIFAACTVHYWNALHAWFMFMVGSGIWMLERHATPPATAAGQMVRNTGRSQAESVRRRSGDHSRTPK